ncbi:hypothetical protein J6590_085456 [Homalodisca vitripennis]|nr:hypothetical protein J6590_085456 [Homalodisca vitripennis]
MKSDEPRSFFARSSFKQKKTWRSPLDSVDACPELLLGVRGLFSADLRIQRRSSFRSLFGTVETKNSCCLLRWAVFYRKKETLVVGTSVDFPLPHRRRSSDACSGDLDNSFLVGNLFQPAKHHSSDIHRFIRKLFPGNDILSRGNFGCPLSECALSTKVKSFDLW